MIRSFHSQSGMKCIVSHSYKVTRAKTTVENNEVRVMRVGACQCWCGKFQPKCSHLTRNEHTLGDSCARPTMVLDSSRKIVPPGTPSRNSSGTHLVAHVLRGRGNNPLVRFAPGFFSDEREMDVRYARHAQAETLEENTQSGSIGSIAAHEIQSCLKGDFGESRQFHIPVARLIANRMQVSALLLFQGILGGWMLAVSAALPLSSLRRGGSLFGLPFTILLAVPAAAMATACILADTGGAVLVLSLIIGAREFKFLRILLQGMWRSPHLLQGRAQGLSRWCLVKTHILPNALQRLVALTTLSIVTGLGALFPVEVVFTVPGVGQLAWSAIMNRDLPVVVAISFLMAAVVGGAGMLSARDFSPEFA